MKCPSGPSFALGLPLCLAGAMLISNASATDLDMLVRLLVPAYMAQNFAAVCTSENPQFLSELEHGSATVGAFAEETKKRVTAGLPQDEADKVRVTAADTARQVARHELQLLSRQPAGGPPVSMKTLSRHSEARRLSSIRKPTPPKSKNGSVPGRASSEGVAEPDRSTSVGSRKCCHPEAMNLRSIEWHAQR